MYPQPADTHALPANVQLSLSHRYVFIFSHALFPSLFAFRSILSLAALLPPFTHPPTPPLMSLSHFYVGFSLQSCASLSRAGIGDFYLFSSLPSSIRDSESECSSRSFRVSPPITLPFCPHCGGLADPSQVLIWFLRDELNLSEDPAAQWDLL